MWSLPFFRGFFSSSIKNKVISPQEALYVEVGSFKLALDFPGFQGLNSSQFTHNTVDVHGSVKDFGNQLFLVLCHSTVPEPASLLNLLSLYAYHSRPLIPDIVKFKAMVSSFNSKVKQSVTAMDCGELFNLFLLLEALSPLKQGLINNIRGVMFEVLGEMMSNVSHKDYLKLYMSCVSYPKLETFSKRILNMMGDHISSISTYELLEVLYHSSVNRIQPNPELCKLILNKIEDDVESLCFEEIGLLSFSVYHLRRVSCLSSEFQKYILKIFLEKLKDSRINLTELYTFSFINVFRLIRSLETGHEELFSALRKFVAACGLLSWDVTTCILATYAGSGHYDSGIFAACEKVLTNHLATDTDINIRELARALWSFSYVNHTCSSEFLVLINRALVEFAQTNAHGDFLNLTSDCLLCLVMLGLKPEDLIKVIFGSASSANLTSHNKTKYYYRLSLLYDILCSESYSMEKPSDEVLATVINRSLVDELSSRPVLSTLDTAVHFINSHFSNDVLQLEFPVRTISYASVVYKGMNDSLPTESEFGEKMAHMLNAVSSKPVAVEVMDESTCLADRSTLKGILLLKQRILTNCGWTVNYIHYDEVMESQNKQALAVKLLHCLCQSKSA